MATSWLASPLGLTLLAGGFTTLGVVLTIGYQALADRRANKAAELDRFAPERRDTYERFYALHQRQRTYNDALRQLIVAGHHGKTDISDEEQAAFPESAMRELMTSLDEIRRVARLYSVITAAEAMLQLFVDMTAANRPAFEVPAKDDEITWFVLQRLMDDRVSEFVHNYREDLGLGPPAGAPKMWPVVRRKRPWSVQESEAIVRAVIAQRRGELDPPEG
jgi:hypothetical protein